MARRKRMGGAPVGAWRCGWSHVAARISRILDRAAPGVGDTLVVRKTLTEGDRRLFHVLGLNSPEFAVVKRRPLTLKRTGAAS